MPVIFIHLVPQMPLWGEEGLSGGNGLIALPLCLNFPIKSEPRGNCALSCAFPSNIETHPLLWNLPNMRLVGGLTTTTAAAVK